MIAVVIFSASAIDWVLLRYAAAMPFDLKLSTWSFISDISGEMTTLRPSIRSAGSW